MKAHDFEQEMYMSEGGVKKFKRYIKECSLGFAKIWDDPDKPCTEKAAPEDLASWAFSEGASWHAEYQEKLEREKK